MVGKKLSSLRTEINKIAPKPITVEVGVIFFAFLTSKLRLSTPNGVIVGPN